MSTGLRFGFKLFSKPADRAKSTGRRPADSQTAAAQPKRSRAATSDTLDAPATKNTSAQAPLARF